MLKSMTGYGRSKLELEGKEYLIEIKAVNHRFIDVCVKLPRDLSYLEENIKKTVLKSVSRGKIDVRITYSNISIQNGNIKINKSLANEYIRQLKEEKLTPFYKKYKFFKIFLISPSLIMVFSV